MSSKVLKPLIRNMPGANEEEIAYESIARRASGGSTTRVEIAVLVLDRGGTGPVGLMISAHRVGPVDVVELATADKDEGKSKASYADADARLRRLNICSLPCFHPRGTASSPTISQGSGCQL
jgi:hypothetical protein